MSLAAMPTLRVPPLPQATSAQLRSFIPSAWSVQIAFDAHDSGTMPLYCAFVAQTNVPVPAPKQMCRASYKPLPLSTFVVHLQSRSEVGVEDYAGHASVGAATWGDMMEIWQSMSSEFLLQLAWSIANLVWP